MKLIGDRGLLLLERSELGVPGTPADDDLRLNIAFDASGFTAADQSWVVAREWNGFLSELRTLEERRQGRATLVAAVPEDLCLEFFSTDRIGHMAVRGQVRRLTTEQFELQLRFAFPFEPDELPRVLRELADFLKP